MILGALPHRAQAQIVQLLLATIRQGSIDG
jgi:hypothetical protein